MIPIRDFAIYVTLASFLAVIMTCGMSDAPTRAWKSFREGMQNTNRQILPDFSHYETLRVLTPSEFPLDDPSRRTIVVGDIHGMIRPLHTLLAAVGYNPDTDVLVHTGDILAKGTHQGSMATLAFMARNNITGVRGNHDQKIVEWRGWINWICKTREGCEWLRRVECRWHKRHDYDDSLALEDFLESEKDTGSFQDKTWWRLIPEEWQLLEDHYRVARAMPDEDYQYLLQLPLRLYIPSAHAYVVHAGLLPSDPRYPYFDAKRQPLAHIPKFQGRISASEPIEQTQVEHLRNLQEVGLLTQIPQNTIPWVVLNMRSVKGKQVSRESKGTPWYNIWKRDLSHCIGYPGGLAASESSEIDAGTGPKKHRLPCYPATVLYGHTASVGLNVRRWTFGLDSGCIYGRRLSAFIIGGPKITIDDDEDEDEDEIGDDDNEDMDLDEQRTSYDPLRVLTAIAADDDDDTNPSGKKKPKSGDVFPFGDRYEGQIVTAKCHRHS